MKSALVILNLSTLDLYADKKGVEAARKLADRMRRKIVAHDGPVYVVDQRWPLADPVSRPRHDLVLAVQLSRDIDWIHFDEDWESWERFLDGLALRLAEDRVENVVLGGLWYDPGGRIGEVTEAAERLQDNFEVRIGRDIVGEIPAVRMGRRK